MKNKTKATTLILIMAITAIAFSQQYDSERDFKVQRNEDGITITKYLGAKTEVRIPPVIQNLPVTSIGALAFFGCSNLTSVTIGNSVTSIGIAAFEDCTSLKSITIPDSVASIGDDAFFGCTSLTSLTIPDIVISIGAHAFYNCTSLTSINIPDSVTSIGRGAFSDTAWLNNQPNDLVYAGKVAYIYKGAMPANTSIILLDSTKGIAGSAFEGCTGLTRVTIPGSVTVIGEDAFYGCISLVSITIPESVTVIGSSAFAFCTSLTSVTFKGTFEPDIFSVYDVFPGDLLFKYLEEGIGTYTRKNGTSEYWTKQ